MGDFAQGPILMAALAVILVALAAAAIIVTRRLASSICAEVPANEADLLPRGMSFAPGYDFDEDQNNRIRNRS